MSAELPQAVRDMLHVHWHRPNCPRAKEWQAHNVKYNNSNFPKVKHLLKLMMQFDMWMNLPHKYSSLCTRPE